MVKSLIWVLAFIIVYVAISYVYSLTEPVEEPVSNQLKYERCIAAFAGNLERLPECDEYLTEE